MELRGGRPDGTMGLAKTLIERYETHGSYEISARISQELKLVLRKYNLDLLDPIFRETLDMITTKISRIFSGNANYFDHWRDIAGYAHLAELHCAKLMAERGTDGIPDCIENTREPKTKHRE